jgi:hypothetical protein
MIRLAPNATLHCPHCGRSQLDIASAFIQRVDGHFVPTLDSCADCQGEYMISPMDDGLIHVARIARGVDA